MSVQSKSPKPLQLFCAYAHEDQTLQHKLKESLEILKKEEVITDCYYRKIGPEKEWHYQVDDRLNTSDIILLLVSENFIASGYCHNNEGNTNAEFKQAMELHNAEKATVIPIILDSIHWINTPFGKLQALPKDTKGNKPVSDWKSRDKAFKNIAQGIREEAKKMVNSTSSKASKNTQTATFSGLGIIVLVGAIWIYSNSQQSNISEPRPTTNILPKTEILNSTGWILIGKINNTSSSLTTEEPLIEPFIDPPVIPSRKSVVTVKYEIDLRKEKPPSSELLQKLQPGDQLVIFQVQQIAKSNQNSPFEVWAQVRKCNQNCQQ
ncbi:toll/interleukin-1 receptor domain-containing protein [Nostoc sp. CENA67]|uniref:Toll/interleukin-1 receptor domain-containing protein n=1 Tax=Amazonocrinis nigriterrae CENA67 TaxID=2794033 RepID=A0A8J7HMK2_9NOST|nr:toll/interleukin-1 receptor domain-containing protein [Amazonocrinis nigriterrae]MBH8562356.1 toll/interleukin-1 receptor domain-containing protein [Amazonocrinis nigriterrae CENA67]MBH8562423.1 toll/interleukin-1 receptor domain-containing protein [Amazonocrinis nigriterrae CENA67]